MGVASALFAAIEGARDGNGFTWQDGVKVGMRLLQHLHQLAGHMG